MTCVYEFVHDIDHETSLYRCIHCGHTQNAADEPTAMECQNQKPKSTAENLNLEIKTERLQDAEC
jgi:DNA-directed RNA polymerase subunit RPC12/RpoP